MMPVFVRITYGLVAVPLILALFLAFLLTFFVDGEPEGGFMDRLFSWMRTIARPLRRQPRLATLVVAA